jgi:hypothetical protein
MLQGGDGAPIETRLMLACETCVTKFNTGIELQHTLLRNAEIAPQSVRRI